MFGDYRVIGEGVGCTVNRKKWVLYWDLPFASTQPFYFGYLIVYKLLKENDLKYSFVCVCVLSNLLSFIFYHSKIHTNQQIKDDTKYYKHLGGTLSLCWSVKFTMYCKVRLWKFCLAYFLKTRNQCLLQKSVVSKYCPTLIQTPSPSDLISECDVPNVNLRYQYS